MCEWLKEGEVDVMLVCETWLRDDQQAVSNDNYEFIGKNREIGQRRGGGLGVYLNRKTTSTFRQIPIKQKEVDKEIMAVEWNSIIICNVYFGVKPEDVGRNVQIMQVVRDIAIEYKDKSVYVAGDFNAHLREFDGRIDANGTTLEEGCNAAGLEICNRAVDGLWGSTRVGNRAGTRDTTIDYLLSNDWGERRIQEAQIVGDTVHSDHLALVWVIARGSQARKVRKRKGKAGKWKLRSEVDWEEYGKQVGVLAQQVSVSEAMVQVAETMIGRTKGGTRPRRKNSPWFDEEVKAGIAERRRCRRMWRKARNRDNANQEQVDKMWEQLSRQRAATATLVAHKKGEWSREWAKELREAGRDGTAMFWKHHKEVMKNAGRVAGDEFEEVKLRLSEKEVTTDRERIRVEVEKFWGDILGRVPNVTPGTGVQEEDRQVLARFRLGGEITLGEVEEAIKKLKRRKAYGVDSIAGEFIRALDGEGVGKVKEELNAILERGRVPEDWKVANVELLYKKGDKDEVSNYRPIAVTSVLGKLLSKIMQARYAAAAEQTNIAGETQYGFRRNRSVDDCILTLNLVREIAKSEKRDLWVCFIDFEKAYDSVSREKLWEMLEELGADQKFIDLWKDWYEGTNVKFNWRGVETNMVETKSGVRQGDPMSPDFFNTMMGTVLKAVEKSGKGFKCRQYVEISSVGLADDMAVITETIDKLREMIGIVVDQIGRLGLRVNVAKSGIMLLNGTSDIEQIVVRNIPFKRLREEKYLGLIVNEKAVGDWTKRVGKIARTVGAAKYGANMSNARREVGRTGWKAVAVPQIMYGCAGRTWTTEELRWYEKEQHDFGRWLFRLRGKPCNGAVRGEVGVSTFEEREALIRQKYLIKLVFLEDDAKIKRLAQYVIAGGTDSQWQDRMAWAASKYGAEQDLCHLTAYADLSVRGLSNLGVPVMSKKQWLKVVENRTRSVGRAIWQDSMKEKRTASRYLKCKDAPRYEKWIGDGRECELLVKARVGCIELRGEPKWEFKYTPEERLCVCGDRETVEHVMWECGRYAGELREQLVRAVDGDDRVEWDRTERALFGKGMNVAKKMLVYVFSIRQE